MLRAQMPLRALYYALWIAPVPVFAWMTLVMVRRKMQRVYPIFAAFAALQVAIFAADFYFYHRSQILYFYSYYTTAAVGVLLSFGVLYEVFGDVFRPFADLRGLGRVLFRWAGAVLTLAAILLALNGPSMAGSTPLFTTILNLMRSVEVMQCGLVLLMLLCSTYLGITLRHRVFGIALGFGILAAVDLMVVAVLATYGQQATRFVQIAKMLAYNLSAVLWLGYVYAGKVERKPTKQFALAESWNYALATAVHPDNDAPALPFIEHAVERVWKQTNGHNGDNTPPTAGQ